MSPHCKAPPTLALGLYWGYIKVILGFSWGYIKVILGFSWGYIRIILGFSWGYIRVILGFSCGYIRVILGLYWGFLGVILGLYWGYIGVILGFSWGYIGIMEKKMETTIFCLFGSTSVCFLLSPLLSPSLLRDGVSSRTCARMSGIQDFPRSCSRILHQILELSDYLRNYWGFYSLVWVCKRCEGRRGLRSLSSCLISCTLTKVHLKA